MASRPDSGSNRSNQLRRRILAVCGIAVLFVVFTIALRAATLESLQPDPGESPALPAIDRETATKHLAAAVARATIAQRPEHARAFEDLESELRANFPRVFETFDAERVGQHALLLHWPGRDPSLPPLVLLAHLDVVPVDPGSENDWTHPPFSGVVADGAVWGRGTIDDKVSVVGILEAVNVLLGVGFEPERGLYLAFGDDEEVGGLGGAKLMAHALEGRGVRPYMILDEGGATVEGALPGFDAVAFVGIAEKGYLSVELRVAAKGGHSSSPPAETAIGILAAAIDALERHPPAARFGVVNSTTATWLAPQAPLAGRVILANLWLFRPAVVRLMTRNPETAALVRTTTAPTILTAGTKDNVLPTRATAVVNFRIAPHQSRAEVLEHVRRTIADDRVEVLSFDEGQEPSPVSQVDTDAFRDLAQVIRQTHPDAIVAPYLVVGGTDAKHFAHLSDAVYRYLPIRGTQEILSRIHGTNERLEIDEFVVAIAFYVRLIRRVCG